MYPPPVGPDLTREQARELDDTFLSSDPFGYFKSRIASLLAWLETAPQGQPLATPTRDSRWGEFNRFLQRPALSGPFREVDIESQVAADALIVRHQAAETLARFAWTRINPAAGEVPCLWAELENGPAATGELLIQLSRAGKDHDAGERFFELVTPPAERQATRTNPAVVEAANVFAEWLAYACEQLVSRQDIDLYAAHNKLKHGLAVRARADLRVGFSTSSPLGADQDRFDVPVSSFDSHEIIDIFDQPVLESLTRGPKVDGQPQGLELTMIRLHPAAILAEAYMLAWTHAAMFHVAAVEHFAGRGDLEDYQRPPAYPGLPLGGGPKPEHIEHHTPLGMRFPLTTPPGGGPTRRPPGIGFRDGLHTDFRIFDFDYGGRRRGRIVDE
jgi:hypothetical protein